MQVNAYRRKTLFSLYSYSLVLLLSNASVILYYDALCFYVLLFITSHSLTRFLWHDILGNLIIIKFVQKYLIEKIIILILKIK